MSTHVEALGPPELAALLRPEAYPHDRRAGEGIELVQTHISWVFLTPERVYKFRKPAALGFLDFTSRDARTEDCLRELALNRRLAPDVYLGIAPLRPCATGACIGKTTETETAGAEHCVVMRRLAPGLDALSLLESGRLTPEMLGQLATHIAAFHVRFNLGRPAPWSRSDWRTRFARPANANFDVLRNLGEDLAPRRDLERVTTAALRFLTEHATDIERRRREGRAVDGHGDLHLAHVWYESPRAQPLAIDCIEFSDDLRRIDGAADVAFLAMDLSYRGRSDLGEVFLSAYAAASGDYHLYSVVDYHIAYRACVRAKVAALTATDETVEARQRERAAGSARRHLAFAADVLERQSIPTLLILCGIVGTGKSTAARRLARRLTAPCIASDRLRESVLADVPRTQRYTTARRRRVYADLLRAAADVLGSGRTVVLDATFESADSRARALEVAREAGAVAWLVQTEADEKAVLERLASRFAAGRDPSDAGPEQYRASLRRFEAPDEWPEERRIRLRTDRDGWETGLEAIVRRIGAKTIDAH